MAISCYYRKALSNVVNVFVVNASTTFCIYLLFCVCKFHLRWCVSSMCVCVYASRIKPYKKLFLKVLIFLRLCIGKTCCTKLGTKYKCEIRFQIIIVNTFSVRMRWVLKKIDAVISCMGYLRFVIKDIVFVFVFECEATHIQCSPTSHQTRQNWILSIRYRK